MTKLSIFKPATAGVKDAVNEGVMLEVRVADIELDEVGVAEGEPVGEEEDVSVAVTDRLRAIAEAMKEIMRPFFFGEDDMILIFFMGYLID